MMALQESLDFTRPITRREMFEAFNAANPQVYANLEKLAGQLISKGRKKIGIGLLTEVLRWEFYLQTEDPNSEYAINNNYRSYYARLLVERHPEWNEAFELRHLRST